MRETEKLRGRWRPALPAVNIPDSFYTLTIPGPSAYRVKLGSNCLEHKGVCRWRCGFVWQLWSTGPGRRELEDGMATTIEQAAAAAERALWNRLSLRQKAEMIRRAERLKRTSGRGRPSGAQTGSRPTRAKGQPRRARRP